jgi:hypothetical protein
MLVASAGDSLATFGIAALASNATRPLEVFNHANHIDRADFGERSPAPFLINASFINLFDEPLVNSPRDAVRSFYSSGVDALVIDGFMLAKR